MGIRNSLSFLFLALAWLACIGVVSAGAPHQKDVSASVDVSNLDASHSVDPTAVVDYVVNFYENEVSEQDMDMVAAWLEQRKISVKEKQKAHYAAYIVAELNKAIANELFDYGKQHNLHIEEIEPDYLDWSDIDKEDL